MPGRRARRLRLAGTAGAAVLAGVVLSSASAQQAGLPQLTLDVSPRVETTLGSGNGPLAVTGLAFSLLDSTPSQTLSLSATGSVQAGGAGDALSTSGPVLRFGYGRTAAEGQASVGATLRRDEVQDLADLSDFVDDNGVIVLPPDFDLLSGTGIRNEVTASASLALRQNRPLSYSLSAAVTDLSYEDADLPSLVDNRRLNLGAAARLAFPGQRTVTVGVRYAAFDQDGAPLRETWGLDLGASADQPRGPLTASLSFDRTSSGTRAAASLGRTLAFPSGSVSGQLGVSRSETGDLSPTLGLSFQRSHPGGTVSLSATQALRSGLNDQEELATTLGASLGQTLTPRLDLSLSTLLAATEPTGGTGSSTRAADLGASVSYRLTPGWNVNGGVSSRVTDGAAGVTRRTTVFVGFSRRFQGTF